MDKMSATEVEITCLCGKARESISLNTTIPADSIACHCNTCRWTTGTLFQSLLPIEAVPKSIHHLSVYHSSTQTSRYFCDTCGTHVCRQNHRDGSWYVSSGIVDRLLGSEQVSSCSLQRIAAHQFVADTADGGLAACLAGSPESSAVFYVRGVGSETCDLLSETSSLPSRSSSANKSSLRAACDCGGVEFYLSRPDKGSRACSSPWPDLLRPYYRCDPNNPADEKWWIRDLARYLAGTCACRTCRLSSSSPITTWAFVPRANLSQSDGSPIDFNTGTLKGYQSSAGTTREFCRVCGASIFWHSDQRPELLDVSVGLLRAEEGARAGTWLEWCTDRVSFAENAFDHATITTFETGLSRIKNQ